MIRGLRTLSLRTPSRCGLPILIVVMVALGLPGVLRADDSLQSLQVEIQTRQVEIQSPLAEIQTLPFDTPSPQAEKPTGEISASKRSTTFKVFGTDDRQLVGDTTLFPWSTIGVIQATWNLSNGQKFFSTGTGVLIGDSMVLTAGHCIYDQDRGWAHEVVFIPGLNGVMEPFGRATAVRLISQSAWVDKDDGRYDIGLMVIDQPLGRSAGTLSVGVEADSFFVNCSLNTAGYPGETKPGNVQYHAAGSSIDIQDGVIRHYLDSEPGQSGSPIWYYNAVSDQREIVGVLTGSRQIMVNNQPTDSYNIGVRIDTTLQDWINESMAKYDSATPQTTVPESVVPKSVVPACGSGVWASMLMTMALLRMMQALSARQAPLVR